MENSTEITGNLRQVVKLNGQGYNMDKDKDNG